MSSLLNCHKISKSYSSSFLFKNLSINIGEKEKIGIIGPNGSGKSTLSKILAREEETDEGSIAYQKGLSVRYIAQQDHYADQDSIYDLFLKKIAPKKNDEHFKQEILRITSQLGISNLEQKVSTLSGGWIKKLEVASSLIGDCDLAIFDEPTNHLDLRSILWLEETLDKAAFSWVCVSHDRFLLNKLAKKIIEINAIYTDKHFISNGSYEDFQTKKKQYLITQKSLKSSLQTKLKREKEWLSKNPKARSTKAKFRVEQVDTLEKKYSTVSDKMTTKTYNFNFLETGSKTKKLLEIKNLSLKIGDKTLKSSQTLFFTPQQKIALLGLNGSGKTSFLKAILGELPLTSGTIKTANHLKIAHFDQAKKDFNTEKTLKNYLSDGADTVLYREQAVHINSWASKFGFSTSQVDNPISKLSGGEKARALIAKLILQPADLLLLDEPTNDLDIPTLEVLEDCLRSFTGCLILISHDRYLLDNIAQGFLAIDKKSELRSYISRSEWQKEIFSETRKTKEKKLSKHEEEKVKKKKLSYMEQREFDSIEEKVSSLEEEVESIKKKLEENATSSDHTVLLENSQKLEKKQEELDKLYSRWQELEEKQI